MPEEDLTLGRFIDQVAGRYAEREALVLGRQRYSYRDLRQQVRHTAKTLLALGVSKGTRVALLVANSPEFVFAAFGAASIGAVVVPMSTMASPEEREYVLRHCDASLLVLQPTIRNRRLLREFVERHPAFANATSGQLADPAFPFLRHVVVSPTSAEAAREGNGAEAAGTAAPGATSKGPVPRGSAAGIELGHVMVPWGEAQRLGEGVDDALLQAAMDQVHPSDDAMIIYTSGTTAHPKAVIHVQRAPCIQSWRWSEQLALSPDDRVWTSFPFFWTAGFSMSLGGTLAAGACLVLQEVFDAGEALALIEREKVTTIHAFEHTNAVLADHPDVRTRDLSAVRHLPKDSPLGAVLGMSSAAGDPRAAFGLTETFTIATSIPSHSPYEIRMTTHGRALPGMRIKIVDPESGAALDAGGIGEIAVKGVTLMRGYYKAFPEEYFDEDGWFRTGDSGFLDQEGYLHWTGRLSNLVKTGGANVSPVEVEDKAAELGLFGVTTVVGVPHPTLGEAVVLCAVPLVGATVEADEVRARLSRDLAHYKVPRRILLFTEEELSFTGTDKVRISQVRELAMRRLAATDPDDKWSSFLASLVDREPVERAGAQDGGAC